MKQSKLLLEGLSSFEKRKLVLRPCAGIYVWPAGLPACFYK